MNDSRQLIRQWRLLQMLADSRVGYTVQELCEDMGVSMKTIRRDLNVLQSSGFDLIEAVGDFGLKRWRMPGFENLLSFSVTELLSILMARRFLEPLAGTPFWDGQHKVFSKIRGALGEQAVRYLRKLTGALHTTSIGASDYSQRGQLIDELMLAIEDRLISLITYQSDQSTEPVEQEVYPLALVHHRGSLYLIAFSSRRREIRTYKVDRIDAVNVTKLPAAVPEHFDLAEYMRECFGIYHGTGHRPQTIRIRFARDVARYIRESRWHTSQQLTDQPDGTVIAEFRLPDTTEIKRWIMSFGPNAQVLEPAALVEEIQKELSQMQNAYRIQQELVE